VRSLLQIAKQQGGRHTTSHREVEGPFRNPSSKPTEAWRRIRCCQRDSWEKSDTIVSDIVTVLTRSLIPFPRAHSSSSRGSASPLYSASSSDCKSVRSLGFCRELRRCWARNVANWFRRFTPQSRIIKDSSFDENACLEGWTVQAPCWRDPSNTKNRASQFDQID
jgi:hypothetical protein